MLDDYDIDYEDYVPPAPVVKTEVQEDIFIQPDSCIYPNAMGELYLYSSLDPPFEVNLSDGVAKLEPEVWIGQVSLKSVLDDSNEHFVIIRARGDKTIDALYKEGAYKRVKTTEAMKYVSDYKAKGYQALNDDNRILDSESYQIIMDTGKVSFV